MTVLENLEMGAFQRKRPGRDPGGLDRVFTLFPRLEERESQRAGTMSGGEQQMCAIGRALMARPKLLMLDEPSMGLAPIFVEKIFEIISEINEQGTTILLVEQNALMALDTAQRGYVMETGHDRPRRRREGAARERAGPEDVPRHRVAAEGPRRADAEREVRGGEQVADARRPVGAAVRHGERGADAMRGDEAELPCGGGVPAAGDEHGAEAPDAGWQADHSRNGRSGWHGAARAVGVERAAVGRRPLARRPTRSPGSRAPLDRSAWKRAR